MNTTPILVTGAAGFIGMQCSARLLAQGHPVIGIDNLNDYYDPRLKQARLARLTPHAGFRFIETDIADREAIEALFAEMRPGRVLHLAAQAGVRYSLKNPHAYVQSNLVGFVNILEACRHHDVQHLVYASSSSVYGANTKVPFAVSDPVDHPVSLYAATKKSNELMAYSYSHLYGIPTTGLRFFTVYGPWGRPDMSPWLFTSAILEGRTIDVFNHGKMQRDFTYIDDIVEGTLRVLDHGPTGKPPYHLYNIGNHQPVELMDFIGTLERVLGVEAKKNFLPMQPGDVPVTYADTEDLRRDVGFAPSTPLSQGLQHWADWYRGYVPR
jgi:UDP-glucuronate 4-epimerase